MADMYGLAVIIIVSLMGIGLQIFSTWFFFGPFWVDFHVLLEFRLKQRRARARDREAKMAIAIVETTWIRVVRLLFVVMMFFLTLLLFQMGKWIAGSNETVVGFELVSFFIAAASIPFAWFRKIPKTL